MREELSAAVTAFIAALKIPDQPPELSDAEKEALVLLTDLATRCRSVVERDGRYREVELVPQAELLGRLQATPGASRGAVHHICTTFAELFPPIAAGEPLSSRVRVAASSWLGCVGPTSPRRHSFRSFCAQSPGFAARGASPAFHSPWRGRTDWRVV